MDTPNPHAMSPDPATLHFYFSRRNHSDRSFSKEHGGWVIFGYSVARLICCLSLLGLSMKTLSGCQELSNDLGAGVTRDWAKCPEVYMTATYVSYLITFIQSKLTCPISYNL